MRAMATAGLGFVTVGGGALALDMALFRAAGLYVCPELCSVSGPKTGNWTRFVSNEDLKWCTNQTMLLSLPVYTPLADDSSHSVFYACLSSRGNEVEERVKDVEKRAVQGRIVPSKVGFLQSRSLGRSPNFVGDASAAIKELQAKYLDVPNTDTNQTMYFAKRGDAAVGVYVGGDVQKQGIAATLMQRLDQHLGSGSPPARTALFQLCGDGRNADSVAGVVADGRGGLDSVFAVQEFVRTWAESRCVADMEGSRTTETVPIAYVSTGDGPAPAMRLERRADCSVRQVIDGDSCGSMAAKCGLSPAAFTELHRDDGFCSGLRSGQWVCCSPGRLPDMRPRRGPDGSCFPYTVRGGDSCAKIAAAHGLKASDIERLNRKTWGFSGCRSLWPDMYICLSAGEPPMPAPVANARCGPQVAGTRPGKALAELNPCPLKACCNVWGQCGTTRESCVPASLGPPGTAKPGSNGCISHCGMDIVNNAVGPASQMVLGYFEAWNYRRGCLHMDVTQMSKSITHVHFAFVDVTAGFVVSTAQVQEQWDKFKALAGHHKVVDFGGWAASTEPTSYWIFREGVKPGNRERLASNLADFILYVSASSVRCENKPDVVVTGPITWTGLTSTGVSRWCRLSGAVSERD